MKFDRAENGRRTVTFEVGDYEYHEQVVGTKALGVLTAKWARDPQERIQPARLAAKIGVLKIADKVDDERIPIPTTMPLLRQEARLLNTALREFIDYAPSAIISSLMAQDMYGSNILAVQADMAGTMFAQLEEEFGALPIAPKEPFGFR